MNAPGGEEKSNRSGWAKLGAGIEGHVDIAILTPEQISSDGVARTKSPSSILGMHGSRNSARPGSAGVKGGHQSRSDDYGDGAKAKEGRPEVGGRLWLEAVGVGWG